MRSAVTTAVLSVMWASTKGHYRLAVLGETIVYADLYLVGRRLTAPLESREKHFSEQQVS